MRNLFKMIEEPRVARIMQLIIYCIFLTVGFYTLSDKPDRLENVIGVFLLSLFSCFIIVGAIIGVISVLPGIWWLERVGLIFLISGLLMYFVMIVYADASLTGTLIVLIMIISKCQRWFEIKDWQLAPRKD